MAHQAWLRREVLPLLILTVYEYKEDIQKRVYLHYKLKCSLRGSGLGFIWLCFLFCCSFVFIISKVLLDLINPGFMALLKCCWFLVVRMSEKSIFPEGRLLSSSWMLVYQARCWHQSQSPWLHLYGSFTESSPKNRREVLLVLHSPVDCALCWRLTIGYFLIKTWFSAWKQPFLTAWIRGWTKRACFVKPLHYEWVLLFKSWKKLKEEYYFIRSIIWKL